jgi:hypothetical protein
MKSKTTRKNTTRKNIKTRKNIQTRKNIHTKPYIVLEKYSKNVFGTLINIFILKFNTRYNCNTYLTLKKKSDYIKKHVFQNIHLFKYLTKHKILTTKIFKKDKHIMEKIINEMNINEKYTFCLNKDTLIFAETKTTENNSMLKDWLSKHIMLCGETACASGELIVKKHMFIFDNASGTFKPTFQNLQSLYQAIPFLKFKIVDIHS